VANEAFSKAEDADEDRRAADEDEEGTNEDADILFIIFFSSFGVTLMTAIAVRFLFTGL